MKEKQPREYKEVVIIGNGPSGLFMSYLLSGHCPTYNGGKHPETMLNAALNCLGTGRSLYDADLSTLAQSVEGSGTPVGVLMDKLLRPGADIGSRMPSLLDWRCHKSIQHVIIGKGPPGGSWHSIESDTLTLSLSDWMELPGLKFEGESKRVKASSVAKYFIKYARKNNLQRYLRRGTVTSIKPCDDINGKTNWIVEGHHNNIKFAYDCRYVVLASGTYDVPTKLGVEGENYPWVHHSLKSLEEQLTINQTILIVGSGLSASDAVLACRFRQSEVRHIFRSTTNTMEKSLHSSMYPDYHKVWQMMNVGDAGYPGYYSYGGCSITSFNENNNQRFATIKRPNGKIESIRIDMAVVLIGSTADLRYTHKEDLGRIPGPVHPRGNPILSENTTCEILRLPNSFVIGSLAGENFVRNITGAAVLAATRIYKNTQ